MAFFFRKRFRPVDEGDALRRVLEPIGEKYKVPALAGAIFTTEGVVGVAATGVRKMGTTVAATADDLWHIGSNTKAMTAALVGSFVAEGQLSWDAKAVSFFPEMERLIGSPMKDVTLDQVLRHQGGLQGNIDWRARLEPLIEGRRIATEMAFTSPAQAPGTFGYSNLGYVVLAAVLERITGKSWEELMRERIFGPLGMESAGFGGTGTIGQIDQPWPHLKTGEPAKSNGPEMDNPKIMGPSGQVHCSMKDWASFLIDQLRGGTGLKALLPKEIYLAMQTSRADSHEHGYGWFVCERDWAGGKALVHSGSNTMNISNCWLAPVKGFGVLACSNYGGENRHKVSDEAVSALIAWHLNNSKGKA